MVPACRFFTFSRKGYTHTFVSLDWTALLNHLSQDAEDMFLFSPGQTPIKWVGLESENTRSLGIVGVLVAI